MTGQRGMYRKTSLYHIVHNCIQASPFHHLPQYQASHLYRTLNLHRCTRDALTPLTPFGPSPPTSTYPKPQLPPSFRTTAKLAHALSSPFIHPSFSYQVSTSPPPARSEPGPHTPPPFVRGSIWNRLASRGRAKIRKPGPRSSFRSRHSVVSEVCVRGQFSHGRAAETRGRGCMKFLVRLYNMIMRALS